jgi:DNA repair protein RecO (recombination protein O)
MNLELRRAFILHRRPYRNTSLLLEVFAEGEGRFPAIMRGAAKGKSVGLLQAFVPLRVRWGGQGEVKSLHQAEADDFYLHALHGKALYCGLYLNELLMRLMPRGEAHDGLLADYIRALAALASDAPPDWTLRRFELHLLQDLGYALAVDQTIAGEVVQAAGYYVYQQNAGFSLAAADSSGAIAGEVLIALQQDSCEDPALRRAAKQLLRSVIDYYLGYKPLKSRELFL